MQLFHPQGWQCALHCLPRQLVAEQHRVMLQPQDSCLDTFLNRARRLRENRLEQPQLSVRWHNRRQIKNGAPLWREMRDPCENSCPHCFGHTSIATCKHLGHVEGISTRHFVQLVTGTMCLTCQSSYGLARERRQMQA